MNVRLDQILIYHITDVANLPGILAARGLRSDIAMAEPNPEVIGYSHIKHRRMTQIRVDSCGGRFVGEFVPFYFCPRSPMLYTVNLGNTGRTPGCQQTIVLGKYLSRRNQPESAMGNQRRQCRDIPRIIFV